jgi:tRNA (uracil-5-)-methyltransferase
MKFGDRIEGTITRFDQKGRGVFDLERPNAPSRPVVIPFTTIGDQVEATFIKRDKEALVAELVRVVAPGPDRIPYTSPLFEKYPGGLWMHIAYDAQLRFKRDLINAAFDDAGHEERVSEVIPSPLTKHFRNRMDYAVSWDGRIGLKEFGSWNRYRDITEDPLLSDAVGPVLETCRRLMRELHLAPWDNKKYEGDLRYVMIREGKTSGERLVGLIVKDLSHITQEMKDFLRRELDPHATQIVLGENPLITDLSVATTIEVLKGDGVLRETVNGLTYTIHLNSFFQTNPGVAGLLQKKVADYAMTSHPSRVLDLYCGMGFLGIYLAHQEPSVHVAGFEMDEHAIKLAKENAKTNGVADRCEFTSGPAEDLSWKQIPADVLILDPPRAGLHPRVLKTVMEKRPEEIVYVSCNFYNLVKDLVQLKTLYRIEKLEAADMFPQTPHVEVVAKLVLK